MARIITDLSQEFNPADKPQHKRGKPTQKQLGDISAKVDAELKERSRYICEVQVHCNGAPAAERAHTKGRRTIPHKTTVDDLFHACKDCHMWLDESVDGIRFKKQVREIGTTAWLTGPWR